MVDSSVWIDLFADHETLQTTHLRRLIATRRSVVVGDLILTEVLQGTRDDRDFIIALGRLTLFDQVSLVEPSLAVMAARHYRLLRNKGITVRKTIDTLIATFCIARSIPLLYRDRDFDPFVEHLNLRSALTDTGTA